MINRSLNFIRKELRKNTHPNIPMKKTVYKSIFEFSPDAIVVCNSKGEIVMVNQATTLLFGYSQEDLINKRIDILIPTNLREVHQTHFRTFKKYPSPRLMHNEMNLKGQHKDGSLISLSITITKISYEEINDLYLAIIRDTTDFIKKTQALEKTTIQLQEAYHLSKLGSWEYDLVINQLYWSKEVFEIFELDPEVYKPSYKSFTFLVHEADREFVSKSFQDSIENQIPYNVVHRYTTPSGHIKYLRERGVNFYDPSGNVIRTQGSVQDVTEVQKQKKLLNEYIIKLENKNKELEDYTYIAAHDLQEPVNNIKGITDILIAERKSLNPSEQEIEQYINLISGAANKLSTLIKGLMETNRLGQIDSMTEVDFKEVIQGAISNLQNKIRTKNANIIILNELPKVFGFKFELELLFQNLLSNALKFQKPDVTPIIKISCHDQEYSWLFKVEDNGIGIDSRYKDKLFKMFRRLHTQTEIEGTGIGLVQCKKIVEQHNGEIWFESELGKGTVFYFTIRKSNGL